LGGRGRRISEFEASLVYKVSSRTSRATQRNPVSKKQNKQTNKKNHHHHHQQQKKKTKTKIQRVEKGILPSGGKANGIVLKTMLSRNKGRQRNG
jgi:hypothetical protein